MKDTNNLRQELMETPDLDQFLSENQDNFAALYADNIVYSYFTQYKVTFQV